MPDLKIPNSCISNTGISIQEANFDTKTLKDQLDKARDKFDKKIALTIECPIDIHIDGNKYKQQFKVHMMQIDGGRSRDLLMRQDLTLSDVRTIRGVQGSVFAFTHIEKKHVAGFLKSTEYANHKTCSYKLAKEAGYKYAKGTLSIITNAASEIAKLLLNIDDNVDIDSLNDLFPIRGFSGSGGQGWVDPNDPDDKCNACNQNPCVCKCKRCNKNPCVCPCRRCNQNPCICPKPLQEFTVEKLRDRNGVDIPGAYLIKNGKDAIASFPLKIHLKFAYGTMASGNQIKKYKPTDFDLSNAQVIDPDSLEILRQENELILEVSSKVPTFRYEISGLDQNFELIIEENT